MDIFSCSSYARALDEIISRQKTLSPGFTLSRLAKAANIQPSYLSNVLKGRGHFNSDQLYAIAESLSLKDEEIEYLLLLLEVEKTALPKRREVLQKKMNVLQNQYKTTSARLKAKPPSISAHEMEEYYFDPYVQLTHLFLDFRPESNAEKIAQYFGISGEHVSQILRLLTRIGYITSEKNGFRVRIKDLHLPKESPICGPYLSMMRLKSLDQLQRLTSREKYSFSATISTSRKVREVLETEFINYLKMAEGLVADSKTEEMYQINFDLFPWQIGTQKKEMKKS